MGKFVYNAEQLTIEYSGKIYVLAKKTPALLQTIEATAEFLKSSNFNVKALYEKILENVSVIIGQQAKDELFPVFEEIDLDFLEALWLELTLKYADRTKSLYKSAVKTK